MKSRFVHLEFFRLDRDREGQGKKGDFVALEVNMRPAGGYTPDMITYGKSQIAADTKHDISNALSLPWKEKYYCAFASRRDSHTYTHTDDDVRREYADKMVMSERMPDILSGAMGNQMFTVRLKTYEEVEEFVRYVHS